MIEKLPPPLQKAVLAYIYVFFSPLFLGELIDKILKTDKTLEGWEKHTRHGMFLVRKQSFHAIYLHIQPAQPPSNQEHWLPQLLFTIAGGAIQPEFPKNQDIYPTYFPLAEKKKHALFIKNKIT